MRLVHLIYRIFRGIVVSAATFVVVVCMLVIGSISFALTNKKEEEIEELADDAAITQHEEEDETDDARRRWFIDLRPTDRIAAIQNASTANGFEPDYQWLLRGPWQARVRR